MAHRRVALLFLLIGCASFPAAQVHPVERVQVSESVMQAMLVKKISPVYPPLARQARIQGTVVVKILINKSGEVYNNELVSGHPMLAPAAMEAVKQWKYQPYLLNGEPMEVETTVQVKFTLTEKPAAGGLVTDAPAEVTGDTLTGSPSPGIGIPQRVRVSSSVSQGLLLKKVTPEYPSDAREQRIQGVVILKASIDKEGNVSRLDLISGHALLAPAAIDAVKQWKYKPYLLNGTLVEVETQILVNFTLSR